MEREIKELPHSAPKRLLWQGLHRRIPEPCAAAMRLTHWHCKTSLAAHSRLALFTTTFSMQVPKLSCLRAAGVGLQPCNLLNKINNLGMLCRNAFILHSFWLPNRSTARKVRGAADHLSYSAPARRPPERSSSGRDWASRSRHAKAAATFTRNRTPFLYGEDGAWRRCSKPPIAISGLARTTRPGDPETGPSTGPAGGEGRS